MFIDSKQVEALYDAVLRPDYEDASLTISDAITKSSTIGATINLGVALPWFQAGISPSASRTGDTQTGQSQTYTPITNPYRHLLALALHYAAQGADKRLVVAHPLDERATGAPANDPAMTWLTPEFIEATPRALVFLDMPPGSRFVPAALELATGEVHVLIDPMGKNLAGSGAPKYPGAGASEEKKNDYFGWYYEKFDDRAALDIVESTVHGSQVSWIDYDVSLDGKEGPFMHLHLAGRAQYETGVFGYNFIVRGLNYGLRIVGTLKSGPDMNVLAVFER